MITYFPCHAFSVCSRVHIHIGLINVYFSLCFHFLPLIPLAVFREFFFSFSSFIILFSFPLCSFQLLAFSFPPFSLSVSLWYVLSLSSPGGGLLVNHWSSGNKQLSSGHRLSVIACYTYLCLKARSRHAAIIYSFLLVGRLSSIWWFIYHSGHALPW